LHGGGGIYEYNRKEEVRDKKCIAINSIPIHVDRIPVISQKMGAE